MALALRPLPPGPWSGAAAIDPDSIVLLVSFELGSSERRERTGGRSDRDRRSVAPRRPGRYFRTDEARHRLPPGGRPGRLPARPAPAGHVPARPPPEPRLAGRRRDPAVRR